MSSVSAPSEAFEEFQEEQEEDGPHMPFFNVHKNKGDITRSMGKLEMAKIIQNLKPKDK
jgi:hypothetical protein